MKWKNVIFHSAIIACIIGALIFSSSVWQEQYPEVIIIITTVKVLFGGFSTILLLNSMLALLRLFTGKSPRREVYLGMAVLSLGILFAQAILLPNLFTDIYDYWIIGEKANSLRISLRILWISVPLFSLLAVLFFGNHFRILKKSKKSVKPTGKLNLWRETLIVDRKLTQQVLLAFSLMILVITPGFMIWLPSFRTSDNPEPRQAAIPIYPLHTGAHYNTQLDLLIGQDAEVLSTIETVCYKIQTMRAECGGYPQAVNPDYSIWRGDERNLYPNEISLQGGTCIGGWLYLNMYQFEANPIYLQLARDAADALVEAQDDVTGGFFTFAEFDAENKAIEPHFLNTRRHTDFDDKVFQDNVKYLLDFYNFTQEQKYSDAANLAFDYLLESQYESGSWPQETNFIYPFYPTLPTLNDGVIVRNIQLLMKGIDLIPSRAFEFQTAIDKAFDWICEVQGNGGSPTQRGWAEQYNFNYQPAWARNFEPPAMCTRETGLMMILLLEMFCRYNETKYLTPIQEAYNWLLTCEMVFTDCDPDLIKINKYYELGTNLPIWGVGGGKLKPEGEKFSYKITDFACGYHNTYAEIAMDRWDALESVGFSITAYLDAIADNSTVMEKQILAYDLVEELTDDGLWYNPSDTEYRMSTNYSNLKQLIGYLSEIL